MARRVTIWCIQLVCLVVFTRRDSIAQIADFKNYTVRQGLLSNAVGALYQDSYGYLWIGTSDGISIYDGVSFHNYTFANGLPSSTVNSIIEDRLHRGTMWVGTNGGGLCRYSHGVFSTFTIGNTPWSNRINSIAQDDSGIIYCATDDGLYEFAGDSSQFVSRDFRRGVYEKIFCTGDSLFILADDEPFSVFVLSNRTRQVLVTRNRKSIHPMTFTFDSSNKLWLSFDDGTVERFEDHLVRKIEQHGAKYMADDHSGGMWLVGPAGICKFDEDHFETTSPILLTTLNGLRADDFTAALVDREGDLWLGFGANGMSKLPAGNTLTFPADNPAFPINNSQAAADIRGHIWALVKTGLLEIWREESGLATSALHRLGNIPTDDPFISVRTTDGGSLWLASRLGRILQYTIVAGRSGASGLRLRKSFSVSVDRSGLGALCFYLEKSGRGWLSVDKSGVEDFDVREHGKVTRLYGVADGLADNSIRAIFTDSKGRSWFGGYIAGLSEFTFAGDTFTARKFTTKDGLPDNSIRAITEDDSGKIWVGTRYGGVAVIDGDRITTITVKDGLISDGIWAITFDKSFGLLFGTQLGLQALTGTDSHTGRWKDISRGFPTYSCGVTRGSLVWAGGPSVLGIMDLGTEENYGAPPPVYVTDLHVNGDRVEVQPSITLPYYRNTLTFDFAGISLRDEGKLTYRYILRGADAAWREATSRAPVTYVSMRPGNYVFEVQAINTAGVPSVRNAILSIVITSPFWTRWWFVTGMIILVVTFIYLMIRLRINRLLAIERIRSRIATDLHDDIGSGLTRIAILADVALRQEESGAGGGRSAGAEPSGADTDLTPRGIVGRIAENARELVDAMRDVVWSIDPKNITIGDFINRLRSFAYEMCEGKGIFLNLDIDGELEGTKADPEILRTLLLVAKEALHNSIRHSGCTQVNVGLKKADKGIELVVADNGGGFRQDDKSGGHGLVNMRRRAEKVGGEFRISSSPSKGAVVKLIVPARA